ncbi:hypothetical protein OpiT1DRAFT_03308 [Opitutaceae bacterium TAV1]|nr:hypothetical protein OpiT1DRAFT_03308 [Opitutaceae bacterium TAV1]
MKIFAHFVIVFGAALFTLGFLYYIETAREIETSGEITASIEAIGQEVVQRGGVRAELPAGSDAQRSIYALNAVRIELAAGDAEITVKASMRGTNGCFRVRDKAQMDSALADLVTQASKDSGIPMHLKPEEQDRR